MGLAFTGISRFLHAVSLSKVLNSQRFRYPRLTSRLPEDKARLSIKHNVTWKRRTQELARHNQSRSVDPFNGRVSTHVRELMDMPGEKIIRLIRREDFRGLTFFTGNVRTDAWRHVMKDQPLTATLLSD
jgi:hypothetical protein